MVKGPVSAEVISVEYEGMMKEAGERAKIAPNIVIKLPITVDGLRAFASAKRPAGVKQNMTLSSSRCRR
ncbi:MAG: hypothetical protein KIT68_05145 [Phycisphaeraceae bacterium]|nr:hypothetical protein [Phycisphaeraceae bacterium]